VELGSSDNASSCLEVLAVTPGGQGAQTHIGGESNGGHLIKHLIEALCSPFAGDRQRWRYPRRLNEMAFVAVGDRIVALHCNLGGGEGPQEVAPLSSLDDLTERIQRLADGEWFELEAETASREAAVGPRTTCSGGTEDHVQRPPAGMSKMQELAWRKRHSHY
jgi:hypothetical protein